MQRNSRKQSPTRLTATAINMVVIEVVTVEDTVEATVAVMEVATEVVATAAETEVVATAAAPNKSPTSV